jgi:hypothetical protein
VTLHARHYGWADKTFGRKWAVPDKDPARSWDSKFSIEDTLDKVALARAKASDANSFLYLAKANQLFVTGNKGALEDGLRDVRAKVAEQALHALAGGVDAMPAQKRAPQSGVGQTSGDLILHVHRRNWGRWGEALICVVDDDGRRAPVTTSGDASSAPASLDVTGRVDTTPQEQPTVTM